MNYFKLTLIILMFSNTLNADVVSVDQNGFALHIERTVSVDADMAYQQFVIPAEWWNSNHTYSGDAKNLKMDAKAAGCFCEYFDNKQVLHMLITYVDPGTEIRMVGGLGPLQMMGLSGGMSWKFEHIGNNQTKITQHYQVSGRIEGDSAALAKIVNEVQTQQLELLVKRLEAAKP